MGTRLTKPPENLKKVLCPDYEWAPEGSGKQMVRREQMLKSLLLILITSRIRLKIEAFGPGPFYLFFISCFLLWSGPVDVIGEPCC